MKMIPQNKNLLYPAIEPQLGSSGANLNWYLQDQFKKNDGLQNENWNWLRESLVDLLWYRIKKCSIGNKRISQKLNSELKMNELTNDQLLEALQNSYGESLICDDNGRWAVAGCGHQNLTDPKIGQLISDGPIFIETVFWIEADEWCDSIREALLKWHKDHVA